MLSLYAVAEIAVFMVGATIIGFLLGRMTKGTVSRVNLGDESAEMAAAQTTIRELTVERASLRGQLDDAKDMVRQLAAETTATEISEVAKELTQQKHNLEKELEAAAAQADRLRATIAERDVRIADLVDGKDPAPGDQTPVPIGYSSSAGTIADMRIIFDEDEEGTVD